MTSVLGKFQSPILWQSLEWSIFVNVLYVLSKNMLFEVRSCSTCFWLHLTLMLNNHAECLLTVKSGQSFCEWVSICMHVYCSFSRVRLFVPPQTVVCQPPLSLGFSRQEYWSGLPFSSPVHACMLSHFSRVQLRATLRTAALQAPLSTGSEP